MKSSVTEKFMRKGYQEEVRDGDGDITPSSYINMKRDH